MERTETNFFLWKKCIIMEFIFFLDFDKIFVFLKLSQRLILNSVVI